MNKFLKVILTYTCLLSFAFFQLSCEFEEFKELEKESIKDQNETSSDSPFTITTIDQNQTLQNKKLKSLFDVRGSNTKSFNNDNTFYYDEDQKFGVDLTNVKYVENGEYHSYTLGVYRDEYEGKIENLLISLQKDRTYKAYLISYILSEESALNLNEGIVDENTKNQVVVEEISIDQELLLPKINHNQNASKNWCKETIISRATGWPVEIDVRCPSDNGDGGNNGGSGTGGGTGGGTGIGGNDGDNNNGGNGNGDSNNPTGGGSSNNNSNNPAVADRPCFDCHGDYSSFVFGASFVKLKRELSYSNHGPEADYLKNIYNFSITEGLATILHNYKNSAKVKDVSKKITAFAMSKPHLRNEQRKKAKSILGIIKDYSILNNTLEYAQKAIDKANKRYVTEISSPITDIKTYEEKVKRITNHLKLFGDPEERIIASYVNSLIPEFTKMKSGEVYDIYKMVVEVDKNLLNKYIYAVVDPLVEAGTPFVIYAITEATLGTAIPLLSRIPSSMVKRGVRLEKFVKGIGVLGTRGSGNNIRIVSTNGAPVTKASELFNKLTKNAVNIRNDANGARVADMGNGNFITFRNASQSGSNFEASINLDFKNIWSSVRVLKFKR